MSGFLFNDSHVHLTNYVQEGPDIKDYLAMMGDTIKRSVLFGLPVQQMWNYAEMGDVPPTYYMQSDSSLYYYSLTDAYLAMQFRSLDKAGQDRFDPLISGFNPADMYAADHVRRVLTTFPGVFCGIGEFSIIKEFVSAKIAGEKATLGNPALGRLFDFAAEVGLVVLIHTDIEKPFPKKGQVPIFARQTKELFMRHPKTTIIWAHVGLGRVVNPIDRQAEVIEDAMQNRDLDHVYFDISWDKVANYAVESEESAQRVAGLINRNPDRVLFGTDCVAPARLQSMLNVFHLYDPVWNRLTPEASRKVRFENHERLFDEAKRRTRAWERENVRGGVTV